MPSPISRPIKHTRKRNKNSEVNQPQPANPIYIASVGVNDANLTLMFDQAVSLNGTPAFTTNIAGVSILSATQTAPDTVMLTFSASISTGTTLNIPFRDPAIRSESGGYVTGNTYRYEVTP